jgi:hypothetical protein
MRQVTRQGKKQQAEQKVGQDIGQETQDNRTRDRAGMETDKAGEGRKGDRGKGQVKGPRRWAYRAADRGRKLGGNRAGAETGAWTQGQVYVGQDTESWMGQGSEKVTKKDGDTKGNGQW